jgi:PAS domain S-box-containing protein
MTSHSALPAPAVAPDTVFGHELPMLRALFASSTDVIFAKDIHGRMQFANPAALSLIGKPLDGVLGRTDAQFLDDQQAARGVMDNDRRIMSTGVAEVVEEEVPLPDGNKRVWLSEKRPFRDGQGRVIGLLGISRDITERKRAEAEIRDARDNLQHVLNSISDGLAILDHDWRYTYVSETGARMLGMRPADLLGKRLWDLYPHADELLFGREYRRAMASGTATHFEDYYPAPLDMWVECHCYPSAAGLSVYFRDVTARRKAQEAAAERQRQIDALLEASPIGVAQIAPSGKVLVMNSEAMRIWGNPALPDNVEEYGEFKGWHADGTERHGQPVAPHDWPTARALAGETVVDAVLEIEPFDQPGTRRTVMHRSVPIHGEDGAVSGAVTAMMDITEQVATKAAMAEGDRRIRQMANTIPQLAWMANADGRIHWYNDRWFAYTGLDAAAPSGREWEAVHDPAEAAMIADEWRRCIATGEPFDMTVRLKGKDGIYRPFYTLAEPLKDASGKVVQWFGTNTDVSGLHKVQEELQTANRRKDEFLAMLAHELRNPLAPISTAAQLLKLGKADARQVTMASDIIGRQVTHMTELIDDLLDVSRVTRGLIQLDKRPVDVKSVVSNAVEQTRPLIESRRQTLSIHMDAVHTTVLGDAVRLVQVVSNVLGNATKYTQHGGRITLRVRARASEVEIAVEDDGSGIDAQLLPHVFDLFTQGQRTPDRAQGGLGLGLALVRSLMELHDGRVMAHSDGPGKGSVFTLILPLEQDAQTHTRMPVVRDTAATRSLDILLVDDNEDAGMLLREILAADGHAVAMFVHPDDALRHLDDHAPKICILDIGLPGMDGYELARRVRARAGMGDATLVALTGYGQPHDKILSAAAGFNFHFVKPVAIDELKAVLERIR